jgi:hypothetical protein
MDFGETGVSVWTEFTSYGSGKGLVTGLSIHERRGIS